LKQQFDYQVLHSNTSVRIALRRLRDEKKRLPKNRNRANWMVKSSAKTAYHDHIQKNKYIFIDK